MRALIWIFFSTFSLSFLAQAKIDDSVDLFFPQSLKYLQYSQTEFPVFWWNFAVIEPEAGRAHFVKAAQLCQELQSQVGHEIRRLVCGDTVRSFLPSLKQWSEDLVLREPGKSLNEIRNSLQSTLNEVSLLSSVNQDLFNLKRQDPLDEWEVYLRKTLNNSPSQLKRENGFLVDPESQRLVIPIQFSSKPQMANILHTQEILERFTSVILVGGHASAFLNEKQVHEDLNIVSVVGILVLVAFIGFLVTQGRTSALLLFPPVALSMGISALIVNQIYGSIHGLTLAFGSGIIGLSVDYGLHGAFNSESRQTWKSNAIGFFTTLIGLTIMIWSGIPLIRQMMLFAALGLFFAFMMFYALCRYIPKYFTMKSLWLPLWEFKRSYWIVAGLIVIGFLSLFRTQLSFDLRKINFQPAQSKKITEWFFAHDKEKGKETENFLLLRPAQESTLSTFKEESKWAQEQGIRYSGLGQFWPGDRKEQLQNLASWQNLCVPLKTRLSKTEKKVFSPFLKDICHESRTALSIEELSIREYSENFVGSNRFISILTAENEKQATAIRSQFPGAKSLVESVNGFSKSLESDLRWMIPLAFFLSSLVLFLYYRSLICVMIAYVPFFTGLGLFSLVNHLRHTELDLISVLGLLMVFGFSLDYGVFATDFYKFPDSGTQKSAVYSTLGLAAMSNIIGFFPMVFAQHPVLHQLGFVLFFGTLGTYFGTIWGVERLWKWSQFAK